MRFQALLLVPLPKGWSVETIGIPLSVSSIQLDDEVLPLDFVDNGLLLV
jgi:hypothetical protein